MIPRPRSKARPLRTLQLAAPAAPVIAAGSPTDGWSKETPLTHGTERRWRKGNKLHVVRCTQRDEAGRRSRQRTHTIYKALIPYKHVLRTARTEPDLDGEPPWANSDMYQHRLVTFSEWADAHRTVDLGRDEFRACHKYIYYSGDPCWIELQYDDLADPFGLYTYQRAHGASKQVARECVAARLRQDVEQICTWLQEGYGSYGAIAEFRGYETSCWGIDDEGYAGYMARTDMVGEVISQLEHDGFTVTDQPQLPKRYRCRGVTYTKAGFRRHLRRQLNLQNPAYEEKIDWDTFQE